MADVPMENRKTLAELESDPRAIVAQVHRTGQPVVVTVDGEPDVVIVNAATYERQLKKLNLAALLAEAERDIQAGRTAPIETFLDELSRGKKVSG